MALYMCLHAKYKQDVEYLCVCVFSGRGYQTSARTRGYLAAIKGNVYGLFTMLLSTGCSWKSRVTGSSVGAAIWLSGRMGT